MIQKAEKTSRGRPQLLFSASPVLGQPINFKVSSGGALGAPGPEAVAAARPGAAPRTRHFSRRDDDDRPGPHDALGRRLFRGRGPGAAGRRARVCEKARPGPRRGRRAEIEVSLFTALSICDRLIHATRRGAERRQISPSQVHKMTLPEVPPFSSTDIPWHKLL